MGPRAHGAIACWITGANYLLPQIIILLRVSAPGAVGPLALTFGLWAYGP